MAAILCGFFCEDLRREMSGQTTAVGMWGSDCVVEVVPCTLRSLTFVVLLANPEQVAYDFTVNIGGDVAADLQQTVTSRLHVDGLQTHSSNVVGLILAPLFVTREGSIRAHLRVETTPPIEQTWSLGIRTSAAR
jgi:hypothetical protein